MSTTEAEIADEKQTKEEADITQTGDEEKRLDGEPRIEEKLAQATTTNASILSASEIRGSTDETVTAESPSNARDAENGLDESESEKEEVSTAEPASNGTEDGWVDILGNGQLMKKVGTLIPVL